MTAEMLWAFGFIALVLLLVGDAYLVKKQRPTMSRAYWDAISGRPFLPFLVGFAIGFFGAHLNWQGEDCTKWMALPAACMERVLSECSR